MDAPIDLTFDVTAGVGSGEQLTQAAWAFLPKRPADAPAVLLCLAGATYDKHYWHLGIDGHPGYSFGEHLADAGYIVIAVDHLGIGESTDPVDSGPLGLELLAAGDAEVARQVCERLRQGRLVDGVEPLDAPLIGVGHSMGSCLTTIVQPTTGAYNAVALLGYGVQITNVHESMPRRRRTGGAYPAKYRDVLPSNRQPSPGAATASVHGLRQSPRRTVGPHRSVGPSGYSIGAQEGFAHLVVGPTDG
jgi:alpha-beta hydrolase superfamily lysophospholipase